MSSNYLSRTHYDTSAGSLEIAHGRRIPASGIQIDLMEIAIVEARAALEEGNPPIGAVLYSPDYGAIWHEHTTDKITGNVLDHAEIRTYNQAKDAVKDNLGSCMLVSTFEPCTMCTAVLTQAKIGSITIGASRNDINGALRRRNIGMHEVLSDGNIDVTVYRGLFKKEIISIFHKYLADHGGATQHGRLFEPKDSK